VVLRVADRFQKAVKPWHTAAVFGRTMTFTGYTDRRSLPRVERQYFFDGNPMLPAVAKVVGVYGLGADLAEHAEQPHGPLVAYGGQAHEPVFRGWPPATLLTAAEVMHVAIFPPHGQLQHVMQLFQGQIRGRQQPPPDRRARAEERNPYLIDFLLPLHPFCLHIKPSSMLP